MLPAQMVQMMDTSYDNDPLTQIRQSTYGNPAYTETAYTETIYSASTRTSYISEKSEKRYTPDIRLAIEEYKDEYPDGISFAWKSVGYTIFNSKTKKKQNIVTGCSGIVHPGEVMAIMGPSGAGKSTLLDILAGRKDQKMVSGQILLNGAPGEVKHVSQYVMQDDALMGVLTVRENIQFAADLCFPPYVAPAERSYRVQQIISEFGLDAVADNKIGTVFVRGVSGGEKRRASIASQIITLPKIIFLDEPTTGLDSAAAYNIIKSIVFMARRHKITVIASIHQPSTETYSLFDKLCLIGKGRTLYFGDRESATTYFEGLGHVCSPYSNPADHFLRLINPDFMLDKIEAEKTINSFINSYDQSKTKANTLSEIRSIAKSSVIHRFSSRQKNSYARGFVDQTYFLTARSFKNAMRNILMFWIRVAMYVCLAILMGITWWQVGFNQDNVQDRFAAHFFSIAFLAFMSVAGIPGFLEERLVVTRERANNFYSVGPYVLANTIISIPFVMIIAASFTAVAYPMIGLHSGFDHALIFYLYLFLALIVAESMVVFISAIIPIFVASLTLVAFANGFFMVVEGFFVRRDKIPKALKWAHYIDYQKWAFEGIIRNDFYGLDFNCEPIPGSSGKYHCLHGDLTGNSSTFTGKDVLDSYGYTEIQLVKWALALVGLTLAFRIGFYIVLRLKKITN
ncbi:P-loop containing nucleoside triphosphate hydrolase protein [Gigaspora rosea]|uniref:P-loop containing nucleoside triphosphate hydrolase protein n=1 Tax=Gigaspora rosea TaxID=44941 RepID=A0A397UQH4_9GLOM|nr:P-loop containing nucleoside triphosphate hydrolase protein [Gigaspora rosea]